MKNNYYKIILSFIMIIFFMTGCAQPGKKVKGFKHDTPLIKTDVKTIGKAEIEKDAKMGPVPAEADTTKFIKRKKISSVKEKNYLLISEEFPNLKQNVSFKFQNMDYEEAMNLMAKIGDINILVGEDVAGSITAELINVPWDKAFNALLDIKN